MIFLNLLYLFTLLAVSSCNDSKIIGGTPIKIQDVPYMALYRPKHATFFCGASIINEQFLVSAAHCVNEQAGMDITVGTDKAMCGGKRYEIEQVFKHPKYKDTPFNNDIAVIKLKNKLKLSDRVKPINLAESNIDIPDSANLRVIGFGATCVNKSSNQLLSAMVPHVSTEKCKEIYGDTITDKMICAGQKDKGGCFGDSGGPLVDGDKLVGVVSFGKAFCNVPTVFARVSALRDFIDDIVANN